MERWASLHISTSVLEQREKYIPSLSSSLNEQLEGANIKAQSSSSQASLQQVPGKHLQEHSFTSGCWGQGWPGRAAKAAAWTPFPGLLHPHTDTAQKNLKAAGKQHLLSPGVSSLPAAAAHRRVPGEVQERSCSPALPTAPQVPPWARQEPSLWAALYGCPCKRHRKKPGTVWVISERSYFCLFLLSKPEITSSSWTSLPVFSLSADTSLWCDKSSLSLLHIFKPWIRWCLRQAGGSASSFHTGKV